MGRSAIAVLVGALVASGCTMASDADPPPPPPPPVQAADLPPAPTAPSGDNPAATTAFEELVAAIRAGLVSRDEIDAFAAVGDARHAWLMSDLLRFAPPDSPEATAMLDGFETLTGLDVRTREGVETGPWNVVTNLLIAWDTPAPPDYRRLKGDLYTFAEPKWGVFFEDEAATIDWRWVSWGGVFIDDRPLGETDDCGARGCIPALDDPALVLADEGDWYPDDAIVFGVRVGDDAVAFPKNVMEVHEMVNITIGGRRLGIPYCTLCGSAQAFDLEDLPDGVDTPLLRTSGLLSRSNKVTYDLVTGSILDTFTGTAVSGPLRESGVVLEQRSVTVSTWAEWRDEHPDTQIVAEDGGIDRRYPDDPLEGRDDDGPIFPIGDVDPRLPVQEPVVGVALDDGTTLAFPTELVRSTIADGGAVELGDVAVVADAGGFVATLDGDEIATHEAFWFAWSQFHPDTLLWPNDA